MATQRPRGYANYSPRPETKKLIAQVIQILDEYSDHWPLTIRQVFYRLVARYDYPKSDDKYTSLAEKLNRARREPRDVPWSLPWEAFRDDGIAELPYFCYEDADHYLQYVRDEAAGFSLDLNARQPVHIEVVCEASGMVPQLARVAHRYGIHVSSCGGFDSVTRKHDLAKRLASLRKPCDLIHIGDLDPSGEHMHANLSEDVGSFFNSYRGCSFELSRVAVTVAQQSIYGLPTSPPKKGDKRRFDSSFTVQAESLDPKVLGDILEQAILGRINTRTYAEALSEQKKIREELIRKFN